MSHIEILSADQTSRWRDKLAQAGVSDVFFFPEYAQTFDNVDGGTPHLFVYEQGDSSLVYPFRLLPLPEAEPFEEFSGWCDITSDYGYGGPVISAPGGEAPSDFIRDAARAFDAFCAEQQVISEFCRFHPLLGNAFYPNSMYQPIFSNQTVWADLTLPEAEFLRQIRKGYRYDIRKAEKIGVEVEVCNAETCLDPFHALYIQTMRDVDADSYYFFNKAFFRDTLRLLENHAAAFLAHYQGEVIAGAFYIWGKELLHYYFSGMNRQYSHVGANKLLLYNAMMWGRKKGLKKLHLGGGVGSSDTDSLMRFKAGFSKQRAEFHVAGRIHDHEVYETLCRRTRTDPDTEPFFPAYRAMHRR